MASLPDSPLAASEKEIQRLKAQIDLLKASRDEAVRSKEEYMQNVAHQLAAPINAVKLNIESLSSKLIPFERKQVLLRSIYAQGSILAHLVKNFSLMSHLDKDHTLQSFVEIPEEVDLYRLCINFANDFQPAGETKSQTITVLEDDFRRAGRPKLKLIKNLFAQVIYNLLENATKYGDADSRITIGLRKGDSRWCILVKSIGQPISEADALRIFERGIRGSNAKALNPAGTGFGLFIARRIMEIHKGNISVEPNGRETIFVVGCPK